MKGLEVTFRGKTVCDIIDENYTSVHVENNDCNNGSWLKSVDVIKRCLKIEQT
jgi:hypothetical protein